MPVCNAHRRRGDCRSLTIGCACVLAAVGLRLPGAMAQAASPAPPDGSSASYRVLPVDDSLRINLRRVKEILRNGRFNDQAEQQLFDGYYRSYALALWSVPENRDRLADYRRRLSLDLRNYRSGPIHAHLNSLVLGYMTNLAKPDPAQGNFHPATRVNAMLMIGELNEVEAATPTATPKPLPQALPVLVDAVKDPQQSDAVKVAALVGIARHAEFGGVNSPEQQTLVAEALLGLIRANVPAGLGAAGQCWMRAQAAEVLGELGSVGDRGAVADALAAMVADGQLPASTRSAAAKAMGQLNYRGASGLDLTGLAIPLGQLAVDASAAEAQADRISRRRLKTRLTAAQVGLAGLATAATGTAHQAKVTELQKSVVAMVDVLENRQFDDVQMLEAVKQEASKLASSLKASAT